MLQHYPGIPTDYAKRNMGGLQQLERPWNKQSHWNCPLTDIWYIAALVALFFPCPGMSPNDSLAKRPLCGWREMRSRPVRSHVFRRTVVYWLYLLLWSFAAAGWYRVSSPRWRGRTLMLHRVWAARSSRLSSSVVPSLFLWWRTEFIGQ